MTLDLIIYGVSKPYLLHKQNAEGSNPSHRRLLIKRKMIIKGHLKQSYKQHFTA